MSEQFQVTGFGKEIFQARYAFHPTEEWVDGCKRVSRHIATAEDGENRQKYEDLFLDVLTKNQFMPGGRIWFGSGRIKAQLLNCFVIPCIDSREGWGEAISNVIVISGTGGGVGLNMLSH